MNCHPHPPDISPELRRLYHHLVEHIDRGFLAIQKDLQTMTPEVTRLLTSVTALKSAAESQTALLQGIAQRLRDSAEDPAAITAIADDLDTETATIVAATLANTPAA